MFTTKNCSGTFISKERMASRYFITFQSLFYKKNFKNCNFLIFYSEFQKVFRASATSFSQGHFYV